jgi:hypothetical protein
VFAFKPFITTVALIALCAAPTLKLKKVILPKRHSECRVEQELVDGTLTYLAWLEDAAGKDTTASRRR